MNKMPSLHELPTELVDKVCTFLDSSAIFNLWLTSKCLARSAEVALYKQITLRDYHNEPSQPAPLDPVTGLFVVLDRYPQLRKRTRSIKISNMKPPEASHVDVIMRAEHYKHRPIEHVPWVLEPFLANESTVRMPICNRGWAVNNESGLLFAVICSLIPRLEGLEIVLPDPEQVVILGWCLPCKSLQTLTTFSIEGTSTDGRRVDFRPADWPDRLTSLTKLRLCEVSPVVESSNFLEDNGGFAALKPFLLENCSIHRIRMSPFENLKVPQPF